MLLDEGSSDKKPPTLCCGNRCKNQDFWCTFWEASKGMWYDTYFWSTKLIIIFRYSMDMEEYVDSPSFRTRKTDQWKEIHDLVISPTNSQILASCSSDQTIRMWSLDAAHKECPCAAILSGGHRDTVSTLVCLIHWLNSSDYWCITGLPSYWKVPFIRWYRSYHMSGKLSFFSSRKSTRH